jgi:hypothetical protein
MRKNTETVVGAFLSHARAGKLGDSISTDGERIFSYRTCIVERTGPRRVAFNVTKYSATTTRQQAEIRRELSRHAFTMEAGDDMPRGMPSIRAWINAHPEHC